MKQHRPHPMVRTVLLVWLAAWAGIQGASGQAPPTAEPAAANPTAADPYHARAKGIRAMGQGIHGAAAQFFLDYRKATGFREPDFADATIHLVKAYVLQQAYDQASAALEYHRANSRGLNEVYYRHALRYWQAAVLLGYGRYAEAAAAAEKVLETAADPEYRSLTLQLLADASIRRELWSVAERHLRQLLSEFPESVLARRARLDLVAVFLASGQMPEAEGALAILERDASPAEQLAIGRSRVLLAVRRGLLDEAWEGYRAIASERPKRPDADWWLAVSELAGALLDAGRTEDALAILPHITSLAVSEDQVVESLLQSAGAQIALKRIPEAVNTLGRFRRDFPNRPEAIPVVLRLAELLRETNNALTAAEYFAEVAANDTAALPLRYRAGISRAWCLREAGRMEDAVRAFQAAEPLGADPAEKARALFLAGDTASSMGSHEEAAAIYATISERHAATEYAEEARFRHGRALFERKLFAEAAEAYARFLADFPNALMAPEARLERGIALRRAAASKEQFLAAVRELRQVIAASPESRFVPRALMEAYEASMGAGDTATAAELLTAIIEQHPDSELFPHALYHRAVVRFVRAEYDKAVADSMRFIESYGDLPLAPELMLQLGDHFANRGDFEQAKAYFSMLASRHPQSNLAPTALYEAALASYRLDHLGSAALLLDQLLAMEIPVPRTETLARAELLYGDILARQDQYERALERFSRARELGADSRLGLAALGRRGEMLFSLASADKRRLQEAIDSFTALTEGRSTPADLWEVAMYRLAKCHEMAGDNAKAIKCYLDIFYQYQDDRRQNRRRDYFYLARSIYDAAHLLELAGTKSDLTSAATLYEYLADLELPTAADARRRAQQIREKNDAVPGREAPPPSAPR